MIFTVTRSVQLLYYISEVHIKKLHVSFYHDCEFVTANGNADSAFLLLNFKALNGMSID